MPYVRLSISTPKDGHRDEVLAMEDELISFFKKQDGFQEAYRLKSETKVGRVTVWESQAKADQAAISQHTLALRARLLPLLLDSIELGLEGERVSA